MNNFTMKVFCSLRAAFLLVAIGLIATATTAQALLDPTTHPKFTVPITFPQRINATNGGNYVVQMEEFATSMGIFNSGGQALTTTVWGYTYGGVQRYLGPTFVTKSNVPIQVQFQNKLPGKNVANYHLLPKDLSFHQARPAMGVPTVPHLHGGHSEWESDGYPEAWFTQDFQEKGAFWQKQTYNYENSQEAATLWYHDHALGITRLNVYAGLAGMYLVRDNNELALPLPTGNYERELIIQDKSFKANGSLNFPTDSTPGLPANSVLPEMFGDFMIVNGKAWPRMNVEPRRYRFRVLNACDSRVMLLKLSNGSPITQIGTETGMLNNPVQLTQLLIAPGERYDLVIDFTGMASGTNIVMQNVALDGPFKGFNPDGTLVGTDPIADPNSTGQVMQFRVNQTLNTSIPNNPVPTTLRAAPPQFLTGADVTRKVALFEGMDDLGRVKPKLGTAANGALAWVEPTTEVSNINDIEVWEIYNNTEDAHPIHIHLVSFQIIDRQEFTADLDPTTSAMTNIQLVGAAVPPSAGEKGWKDTFIVPPGWRGRVRVRFDKPGNYVWHCHILSHEDHDMMRPLKIVNPQQPDCNAITYTGGTNSITVGNLNAPITIVQAYNSTWQQVFNCSGNCTPNTQVIPNLPTGTYFVKADMFDASWQLICRSEKYVTVGGSGTGNLTLTCPSNMTVTAASGASSALVNYTAPMANTTCVTGGLNVLRTAGQASGTSFAIGTHTVSYQATDACGNQKTCSFTITVNSSGGGPDCNTLAFTPGSGNITISNLNAPITIVQVFNSAWVQVFNCSGNCNTGTQVVSNLSSGTYYVKVDLLTASWQKICTKEGYATVGGGNGGTISLTCPANLTVTAAQGATSAIVNYSAPTGSTTCPTSGYTINRSTGQASGTSFAVGNHSVTFTALDACGNQKTCSFSITVNASGGGTDCASIGMTPGAGKITVSNLTAPVVLIQAFTSAWVPVFSCMGNCSKPSQIIPNLSPGGYIIKVDYLNASWVPICQEQRIVQVVAAKLYQPSDVVFSAVKKDGVAALRWTTVLQEKVNYFEIERSAEGQSFETIQRTDAEGQIAEMQHYLRTDEQPFEGDNFYRLRTIYADGRSALSETKRVEFPTIGTFMLYPNPTNSRVFIELGQKNSVETGQFAQIYDSFGRLILEQQLTEGTTKYDIDVNQLLSGVYWVHIRSNAQRVAPQRLVIQR